MMGKAIWDGQRALDVLSVVPDVDPERLGVVGHSLGGYGSIFLRPSTNGSRRLSPAAD